MNREHRLLVALSAITLVLVIDLFCVKTATGRQVARLPEKAVARVARVARTTSVTFRWEPILAEYTGGSYGVDHVNNLWRSAPHDHRRQIVLGAAVHHHVPLRLLLGVWGAESSFGRYACHFGLTGWFPGRGTSGDFRRDAHLAADLFDRLYRSRYDRRAF